MDYSDGLPPFPHLEVPERVERVLAGLKRAGPVTVTRVEAMALEAVRALHAPDYVDFLLELAQTLKDGEEYLPSVFRDGLEKAPLAMRGGEFCREIGTPLTRATVDAALNAAAAAVQGADHVAAGAREAAVLCRPPGHHAGKRRYGGYCYFNNACLAAVRLAAAGRCGVLDLDYHLGDGSVEFAGENMPYFSLHADPYRNYPYIGSETHLNGPGIHLTEIPPGTSGAGYRALLASVLDEVTAAQLDHLVLSLGFDTLGDDYIQDDPVGLTADDFRGIGQQVGGLDIPVLIVLEGGYQAAQLERCAERFMTGFQAGRRAVSASRHG